SRRTTRSRSRSGRRACSRSSPAGPTSSCTSSTRTRRTRPGMRRVCSSCSASVPLVPPAAPVADLVAEPPLRAVHAERELREAERESILGLLGKEPRQVTGLDADRPLELRRFAPDLGAPLLERSDLRLEGGRPVREAGVPGV